MLLLLLALSTQPAAPLPETEVETIVVIGQRIADASAQLEACLARNCRPDEDIDATLRLAESQLMAGKYHAARGVLLDSLRRNKKEAMAYPIPVSDLYRANGKVAAHLGYDQDYYLSTWGIYRTLKHGLPSDEDRRFSALMEVAEMMYRTRGHERARHYYERVAREARKAGRNDIAAVAELRSAIRHLPPGGRLQMQEVRRIAALDGKTMRKPVIEAKMALARLAYQKGDEQAAAAIQEELAQFRIERPILIYAPPYELVERELDSGSDFAFPFAPAPPIGGEPEGAIGTGGPAVTSIVDLAQWSSTKRVAGHFEDMWIDVAFRVTPEGRVSDPRIVRSKGDLTWTGPLMTSIAMRRYTAGKLNDPSSRLIERYTYTSGYEGQTGTRVAQRSPKARIEYVDLSDVAAPR